MKQFINTRQLIIRNQLRNLKYYKEPFFDSLKQGLTAFVAFLLLLGILEFITSIIKARQGTLLDMLDVATAFLGSALMFGWKFLESIHSKR